MKKLSAISRNDVIPLLETKEYDFLIIGGGITGAGVARDAASRGLKVALVEANDFAFGTSSRSSKLIHGGIRYLENLEFGLVFEALSERSKLFEIAPHLVHPLRFTLPVYEGFRVGMAKLGAGMWLYDALSLFQAPESHSRLNAQETLSSLPLLRRKGLKGSFRYADAYMDDDRLVIETLRSAVQLGAKCVNYVKAASPQIVNGQIKSVECVDQLSGRKFSVRAKHIISTVGPWTDELATDFIPGWKRILRPTRGIHLTFARDRIPIEDAVVMTEGERIVFAIPRHEMVIIGTTDTDYTGSLEGVHATSADVDYLFKVIAEYFPNAGLTPKDVLASYAGVRPLVRGEERSEGKTSREHTIISHPLGLTLVAGGKYTTYRQMAAEIVETALKSFPIEARAMLAPAQTNRPISPLASPEKMQQARQQIEDWAHVFYRSTEEVSWLVERFGMEAELILERGTTTDTLWQLEAKQAIHHGMCLGLDDFFSRRVPLFLARRDHGLSELPDVAETFAQELGWSETEVAAQAEGVREHIRREMNWKA